MTDAQTQPAVTTAVADGIMTITLNRPDRGNAWNGAVTAGYFGALEQAARSAEVRAIIVTGAGKAFCVGGDGGELANVADEGSAKSSVDLPFWFPLSVAKPIIAAVNGACFGIGMQQALFCDIRFVSEDAKFSTAYARRGLVAEFGMSWMLPRLVGPGHAMDLLLSARLVRAQEAAAMGLANRVAPAGDLLAEATDYARQLVSLCSPWSMQAVKRQCYTDLMGSVFDSYGQSEDLLAEAVQQDDFKEGIASWQQNRAPAFPPLAAELGVLDLKR